MRDPGFPRPLRKKGPREESRGMQNVASRGEVPPRVDEGIVGTQKANTPRNRIAVIQWRKVLCSGPSRSAAAWGASCGEMS